jgi:hypothetical protein
MSWSRLRRHYESSLRWATQEGVSGSILMVYRRVGGGSVVWLPDYKRTRKEASWALEGARWRILRRL